MKNLKRINFNKKGFSLLELLIYIAIVGTAAAVMTGVLTNVLKVQTRESTSNEVSNQLNFVTQTIQRLIRESSLIDIESATTTSVLKLRMADTAKDPTYITFDANAVKIKQGASATTTLTTDKVIIDTLDFKKFSQYPGHDTVQVDITITSAADSQTSQSLRSAVARISAAAFDSNVEPTAGFEDLLDIGTSTLRWRNLYLSNELDIGSGRFFVDSGGSIGIGTTTPLAILNVISTAASDLFRVDDDGSGDSTPFLIDQDGNVSIGGLLNLGSSSTDPGGQNGSIYYNTASSVFRGYKSGAWADLDTDTRCDVSGLCSQVCIGTDCQASWPSGGGGLWSQNGNDIYYDTGKVGVGTSTPISSLSVEGGGITIGNTLQQGSWHSRIPMNNTTTTIDSSTYNYSSITIGTDGLPVISYYDETDDNLKVVHCTNVSCSTFDTPTTVDSGGDVGASSSITIGADGLPVINYFDNTNDNLKVVHCTNVSCSTFDAPTIVDSGDVGGQSSITIGTDGLPVISYSDYTSGDLKVLHCSELDCSNTGSNVITTVDSLGTFNTSITIGTDGLPVISYVYITNGNLKVLHCSQLDCSDIGSNVITEVGSATNTSSITIGTDGLPVISYLQTISPYRLKVLHCANVSCSSFDTPTTVDSGGDVGGRASITIGTDGLPMISYSTNNGELKVVHCTSASCSTFNTPVVVIDSSSWLREPYIVIGTDGLPVISYSDSTNFKTLHCASPYCISDWTRR